MYQKLAITSLIFTLFCVPIISLHATGDSEYRFPEERAYLLKKLGPLIYGDWSSVDNVNDVYPSFWQRIPYQYRTRMVMRLHGMEEEFRTMFENICEVDFSRCYPNFSKTRVYEVEDNDKIIGYVVQTILTGLPDGDTPGLRMIFHEKGLLVQGPAFFTVSQTNR